MKNYKIIYCSIYDNGFVEQDEFGEEIYRAEEVKAKDKQEAISKFLSMQQFEKVQPEIVDNESI